MWKAVLTTGVAYCSYRELHQQAKNAFVTLQLQNSQIGSGFVIDKSGLALTSKHCTQGTLTTDGQFVQVLARHPELDVALIQLPRHRSYSALRLGHSSQLEVGERLVLYGYFVTELVASTGYFQGTSGSEVYSSCQMRHGQSGGPVVNGSCEVVGINTAHYPCIQTDNSHYGNSIHISIDTVKEWLETVISLQ
jgi:S1-C subfamily serine protease